MTCFQARSVLVCSNRLVHRKALRAWGRMSSARCVSSKALSRTAILFRFLGSRTAGQTRPKLLLSSVAALLLSV